MSAIGPEAHAEFDRLSREALELDPVKEGA